PADAFWRCVRMVPRIPHLRHALALDQTGTRLALWRDQGCGDVRTIHLAGDVAGGHSPARASPAGDQLALVDPARGTLSLRRDTDRRLARQAVVAGPGCPVTSGDQPIPRGIADQIRVARDRHLLQD